jgi:hypothetical protein
MTRITAPGTAAPNAGACGASAAPARSGHARITGPRESAPEANRLLESRPIELVRSSSLMMRALRTARTVGAPDWLIGGALIRDRVWNHLHGRAGCAPGKDVDLSFFEADSPRNDGERRFLGDLTKLAPDISWGVTNQAHVHLWYPRVYGLELPPLRCAADALRTWADTTIAVAVRLMADDRIRVVAPFGLDDLFGLLCRPNPAACSEALYSRHIARQRLRARWPRVQILG